MLSRIDTTHDLVEIEPAEVSVSRISVGELFSLVKDISKATTRPAPGRKFAFAVWHKNQLIGVMGFSSPVINLGVRDEHLSFQRIHQKRAVSCVTMLTCQHAWDCSLSLGIGTLENSSLCLESRLLSLRTINISTVTISWVSLQPL